MAASQLEQSMALEAALVAGAAAVEPMAPDLRRIADLLEALPRPRGVAAGARVLAIELDRDLVSWSDGRMAPLLPVEYSA